MLPEVGVWDHIVVHHRCDAPWNCTVGTRRGTAPGIYLMWLYWLYHVEGGEEAAVSGGFLFQGEGVGSGGGGHAVETHGAILKIEFGIFPGGRWGGAEGLAEGVGGFFSGGDNGLALRDLP